MSKKSQANSSRAQDSMKHLRRKSPFISSTFKLLKNVRLVQAWANRRSRSTGRSPTVRQSIANIFNSKKFIKIEGRYLIIGTQIGANFTGERSKLCFKTIIGKIFSKKTPQPQNNKKFL